MKKKIIFIAVSVCATSLLALSATQNMPLIKNKEYGYPSTSDEAVNMILQGQACFIDKGEYVKRIDSSFSLLKVRSTSSGCVGWAPVEFFK